MRRLMVFMIVCLTAGGCASVPSAAPELQVEALTFTPSPGKARIYVFRAGGFFGSASTLGIAIDSQQVGRARPNTFLMVELDPGHHRVSSPTGENEGAVFVEAMPDSSYFIKLWPKMGVMSANSGMELMDPAEARKAIAQARMVISTWPGTPLGAP